LKTSEQANLGFDGTACKKCRSTQVIHPAIPVCGNCLKEKSRNIVNAFFDGLAAPVCGK